MRMIFATLLASLFFTSTVTGATADATHGTGVEAKAMLERAVAELKADPAAAFAKFNSKDGGFRDRHLYVACFDATTGITQAHADPAQLGKDVRQLKQADGTPFGQMLFDAAKEGVITTVDYLYPSPHGGAPIKKRSYITKTGNEACLVGHYQ